MEDRDIFPPWREPQFKEKITIPGKNTIIKPIKLPEFEINQMEFLIDEKYNFIDIKKLTGEGDKKYAIKDLRDIAVKLKIPLNKENNRKPILTKLIKLKIGLE